MLSLPFRLANLFGSARATPSRGEWLGRFIYAHRGLHSASIAENSPQSFADAIGRGLGIECDLRLSKDGRVIVFHDGQTKRLTGQNGVVAEMGVAELTALQLQPAGGAIPTLRDLLSQVSGQVPLLLEVKVDPGQSVRNMGRAMLRDLEGYQGQFAVMSFDPRLSEWFADKAPHIVRGLVITEKGQRTIMGGLSRSRALAKSRADFLAYDIRDLPSSFASKHRANGMPVLTCTVSTPALRQRALQHADAPIAEAEGLASQKQSP